MVRRRSSPGSSSTTRMRALRLPVWFKLAFLKRPLSAPGVAGLALVQRALNVENGLQLGARLVALLAQPRVLIELGLHAVIGAGHAFMVEPYHFALQPAVFRLERQMLVNL